MLSDFTGAEKVYIACGYTDLRKGIDGLAALVQSQFQLDPFTNTLFLFCGRRCDRINGYTSALKAPVRCFGNHLSGKRKSWFRTDNECGGAAILKTRTSRMGTPVGC